MKRIYLFFLIGAIVFFGLVGFTYKVINDRKSQHSDIHFHAGFQVYIDGEKQDFTSIRYMSITPCGEKMHRLSPEEEQQEKAHLHESIGDVVHVHREGGTWGDLFNNIKFTIDTTKEISGYSSDEKIPDILNKPIVADESIVIVVGDQSSASAFLKNKVTLEHIKEVEKMSELCGKSES